MNADSGLLPVCNDWAAGLPVCIAEKPGQPAAAPRRPAAPSLHPQPAATLSGTQGPAVPGLGDIRRACVLTRDVWRPSARARQAYSALSLAMAMWQFAQTPVRALDEFDKNMDDTFVRRSLQLLVEQFGGARGRQFLILTPLDYATFLRELGLDTPAKQADAGIAFHRLKPARSA